MKTPIQPKKKVEQQQERPNLNRQAVQKKQANINNPFLPNNPNNNTSNPFNPNTNKNNFFVGQMKIAQNASKTVIQANNGFNNARLGQNHDLNGGSVRGVSSEQGQVFNNLNNGLDSINEGFGGIGTHDDNEKNIAKLAGNEETGKELGNEAFQRASGVFGAFGGLISLGGAIMKWSSADGWEKASLACQGTGGVVDMVGGVAGALGFDQVSQIADAVSAGIGAVKAGIETAKGVKEMKGLYDDNEPSAAKLKKGGEIASNATEGVKKGFTAAVKITQAMGGVAGATLGTAIPILGIIISAIDIIKETMDVIEAVKSYSQMKGEKERLQDSDEAKSFLGSGGFFGGTSTNEDKLDLAKNATGFTEKMVDKKVRENGKEVTKKVKERKYNVGKNEEEAKKIQETAHEYAMVRELKKIARKRIVRGVTNVALNVVSVAGDIATLSGVGAGIGVAIKSASAVTKGGIKLFRGAKQMYNNLRGNKKSSTNKHAKRMEQVKYIFSLMGNVKSLYDVYDTNKTNERGLKGNNLKNAQDKTAESLAGVQTMGKKIQVFVSAMGTNVETLNKYKNDPESASKLLYSALKKREASDEVSAK